LTGKRRRESVDGEKPAGGFGTKTHDRVQVLHSFVPQPRKVVHGAGEMRVPAAGVAVVAGGRKETGPAVRVLRDALGADWRTVADAAGTDGGADGAAVRFCLVPQVAGPQSYRLRIVPEGVRAEAQDRAGLFYAALTLAQLIRLAGERALPVCEIEDAPDFPVRGVMLDISRDKVPTMKTLFWLVDRLAGLKVNQFQLYTEHAFAYRSHEEVWRNASPMTPEEVRALDAYCRERCVELVPNQNSFGHLERWLTLPRYNVLAELPQGGAPLPWGGVHEHPASLCPTDPRSAAFLEDLYDQLLPNFSSRLFNVGCDETFDLRGNGRSAALVREQGEGRVYLDFLKTVHRLVTARGRAMMFWGDIIIRHPELVPELPRDAVALEWGYEADHPFDAHGEVFAASGMPFYVCPGTSSWNSLAGRTANMRANMVSAAENGMRHGARGFLVADWGDGGHWQPLAVSLAGYVYGAALAWGLPQNRDVGLAAAMDRFGGADGMGEALLALGDIYLACGALRGNGTELFMVLSRPRTRPVVCGMTAAKLQTALLKLDRIGAAVSGGKAGLVRSETKQVVRLLRTACRRGLELLNGYPYPGFARELDELMRQHARIWRLRNREGGLADSLARFAGIRSEYGAREKR
jgi:hypothetical protein